MHDATHSPASWSAEEAEYSGSGVWCVSDARGWTVCEVRSFNLDADVALIAAAPELYEALASLLQDVEEYVRINNLASGDGRPASNDAMRRAREAISKATPQINEEVR